MGDARWAGKRVFCCFLVALVILTMSISLPALSGYGAKKAAHETAREESLETGGRRRRVLFHSLFPAEPGCRGTATSPSGYRDGRYGIRADRGCTASTAWNRRRVLMEPRRSTCTLPVRRGTGSSGLTQKIGFVIPAGGPGIDRQDKMRLPGRGEHSRPGPETVSGRCRAVPYLLHF